MRMMKSKTKLWALSAGLLGCFCFGGGDWLMMYGNPTFEGKLKWLTIGTADTGNAAGRRRLLCRRR